MLMTYAFGLDHPRVGEEHLPLGTGTAHPRRVRRRDVRPQLHPGADQPHRLHRPTVAATTISKFRISDVSLAIASSKLGAEFELDILNSSKHRQGIHVDGDVLLQRRHAGDAPGAVAWRIAARSRALQQHLRRGARRAAAPAAPAPGRARRSVRRRSRAASRDQQRGVLHRHRQRLVARKTMLISDEPTADSPCAAELHLALEERLVVLRARQADRVVVGMQRLDSASPRALAAAGAAGDLGQQLERALRGAEVGEAQADVGDDHADQRDLREVVALGDHLRADQHVESRARSKRASTRADGAAPLHGVAVDARHARAGQRARTSSSTRSVPKPVLLEVLAAARTARLRQRAPRGRSSGSAPAPRARCTVSGHAAVRDTRAVSPHCRDRAATVA